MTRRADSGTSLTQFQTNFKPIEPRWSDMDNSGQTTHPSAAPGMPDPVRGSVWITAQLRQAIREGRYAHGEKLPAERHFPSAFGASPAPIRSALLRLQPQRLDTRRPGAG